MTHWTDDRVAARLTDTFAAHEADADPAVARRIALTTGPAPRRQWPLIVAAAVAVVLVAGFATYAVHSTGSTQAPVVAPSPSVGTIPIVVPTPAVAGTNRGLARAEAARVLRSIPVPPGSTRSDSAPARGLRDLRTYVGSVDLSLVQTNWWVVPLSYRDLVAWYDAHTPADVGEAYISSHATSPAPQGDFFWQTHDTSKGYSTPAVAVSYDRLGAHTTAIRTDATLAARYDRTSETLVPTTVTRIDITKSAIEGPATPPTTATVTDAALVSRVVSAFDNLDGAFAHATPSACGSPVGIVYVYAVTFHWPGHTLAVDPGQALCGVGRGLTLDGRKLPQTMTDDHALDAALQEALEAS